MSPQIFDIRTSSVLAAIAVALVLATSVTAAAQGSSLQDAVELLRDGEYTSGLEMLDSLEASGDPRVDYYRGYALEKLGQCDAAESAYKRSQNAASNPRLKQVARDALDGFDARCVPPGPSSVGSEPVPESTTPASASAPLPRGSGRVGWKVFGWTTAILGGITLAAIPVKSALEQRAFQRTTPYFEERYGCEVPGGDVDQSSCDKAALVDDPIYEAYQQNRKTADDAGRYMLIGGTTLAGLGVATLVTVAFTRPSAPVRWSVTPTQGGAHVGAVLRF